MCVVRKNSYPHHEEKPSHHATIMGRLVQGDSQKRKAQRRGVQFENSWEEEEEHADIAGYYFSQEKIKNIIPPSPGVPLKKRRLRSKKIVV